MMLSTLFVSALLAGPQSGQVLTWSATTMMLQEVPAVTRQYPAVEGTDDCYEWRPHCVRDTYVTHRAEMLARETVGSLGRVENPFEVPVGISGEGQMAGPATDSRSRTPKALAVDDRNGRRTAHDLASVGTRSCQSAHEGVHDTRLPIVRTLGAPCTRDADAESDGLPFVTSAADESSTQEEQGKPDYILRTGAVFLSALTVAEIEVTRAVIERGGKEQNPIYKPFADKPGALGLVNGAVTGGLGLVALELNRRGKKTEARIFLWTMVAAKAVVFTHNVRELRKTHR